MSISDFWEILAGLGLFLYGMFHLEDSMKQIEGRSFKLFLQKHTQSKLGAIFSGTLVTGILQSSSIVNLMVLSFVGAGMLSMRNAMGVALGANVGGTFNSWLVALLGFKVNITAATMPVLGIAGICMVIFLKHKIVYQIAKFFMGFGLLFLGLDLMKTSMDSMIQSFDFTPYLHYNRIVFVLIGFGITALIQTSSATVVLVLSALYAQIIPIETAVAVVLGAELGTTIKIVIGSIGGIAAKKRVALGNIIFNFTTSLIGFVFLGPIIYFLDKAIGINDPIFILVSFQTFINLVGIVLFYFFLGSFGDFLENRFVESKLVATSFLQNTSPEITDTALDMVEKEVGLFIYRVIHFNMSSFQLDAIPELEKQYNSYSKQNSFARTLSFKEQYGLIKQAEGELFAFYAAMGGQSSSKATNLRLNQLMAAVRNAMYAAKGIKDIVENRIELSNSINVVKFDNYTEFRNKQNVFYHGLIKVFLDVNQSENFKALRELLKMAELHYQEEMVDAYKEAGLGTLKEIDIATLFNVNRELYSSNKAIVFALKDFIFNVDIAEHFEQLA
ncbi:MAG: Na/Pi symporter [Bacteroidota bacterium]